MKKPRFLKKTALIFLEVFLLSLSLSGFQKAPLAIFAQEQGYETLISDSLFLYSPSVLDFNVKAFLDMQPGPLKNYEEQINDEWWTAVETIRFNAIFYGVNPQFILTLLEAQNQLLTDADAGIPTQYWEDRTSRQQTGFYYYVRWLTGHALTAYEQRRNHDSDSQITLLNGETLTVPVEQNAGTYAAQVALAQVLLPDQWGRWVKGTNPLFVSLFSKWFGDPYWDIDRLSAGVMALPGGYILPFTIGETWYYTGGPHHYLGGTPGCTSGSACPRPWSSIDIAPPEIIPCPGGSYPANRWLVAAKGGRVIQSSQALVVIEHDDGQWRTYYSHVATTDRRGIGDISQGEHVGHPSCEVEPEGSTWGVHVHFAIWQAGDGFVDVAGSSLSGWLVQETTHYNGTMTRNGVVRTADTSRTNGFNDILNSGNGCCGCGTQMTYNNINVPLISTAYPNPLLSTVIPTSPPTTLPTLLDVITPTNNIPVEKAVHGYPESFVLNTQRDTVSLTAQIEPQFENIYTDESFTEDFEEIEDLSQVRNSVPELDYSPIQVNIARPASSSYYLARNVIATGGGIKTSASYQVLGTSGQTSGVGQLVSAKYVINSGFWSSIISPSQTHSIYLPLIQRLYAAP